MLVMARPDMDWKKVCFTVPPRAHPSTGSQSQILSVQVRFQGERERGLPEVVHIYSPRASNSCLKIARSIMRHMHKSAIP